MNTNNVASEFELEKSRNIEALGHDSELQKQSLLWNINSSRYKYSYNFTSLGRPIIQFPQDMIAIQELVWSTRPDLIIETGIAHGGSLIQSAAMLALLDYCDAAENGTSLDPAVATRRTLGIDIEIRKHNRLAIEKHPMSHRIDMIEGSSIAQDIIDQVREIASGYQRVMVLLDSNHTHDHVLAELEAYAPLVTKGGYCVVFDTIVEDLPDSMFPNRPWGKGNNPKTAVREYLHQIEKHGRTGADGQPLVFETDLAIQNKLLITVAPDGYLKRI